MSTFRFYVAPLAAAGELSPDQAHHARDVLRLADGQAVVLFDGEGQWAAAKLIIKKKHVNYALTGAIQMDPPPTVQLTIASAVPKGDRAGFLLEQISQLGAARLIWLECRYSVVHPGGDSTKMNKWRRLAIESAKQCARARILSIDPPRTPEQLLAAVPLHGTIIWADVAAPLTLWERMAMLRKAWTSDTNTAAPENHAITIMIGPEGGWSDQERQQLSAVAQPVRLASHILRIETAAATAAAITQTALAADLNANI